MDDARRARLERLLEGYFDTRTSVMVERVIGAVSPDELEDADAVDALFADFVELLEERYDRADAGWRESAETFLRAEFDRQVDRAREWQRSFET